MIYPKKILIFFSLITSIASVLADCAQCPIAVQAFSQQAQSDWLIVGAGPAGIITIGVLLDIGVDPKKIIWLDPEFEVGRLGKYYSTVESNNKAKEFVAFINACAAFQEFTCPAIEALKKLEPEHPCLLESIVEPLRCITAYLRTKVNAVQNTMTDLTFVNDQWYVTTNHGSISAQHVVLATGSSPKTMNINTHQKIIPLDYALDHVTLRTLVTADDVIGVIGGAHSAILLLKYLSTMKVKQVCNFYKHPITYALGQGCWAEDQFGVKGTTGEWAKNVLEKNPPANLTRIQYKEPAELPALLDQHQCNKLIYAIGYQANQLPEVNGTQPTQMYNPHTGVIAPRLFGIGIAFPEYKDDDGHPRHIVGLNCFMDYAQRLVTHWVNDKDTDQVRSFKRAQEQRNILSRMEGLLEIYVL